MKNDRPVLTVGSIDLQSLRLHTAYEIKIPNLTLAEITYSVWFRKIPLSGPAKFSGIIYEDNLITGGFLCTANDLSQAIESEIRALLRRRARNALNGTK